MRKPFTIGVTGGSGSGKTYFLKSLSSRFAAEEICLISQDHYYKPFDQQVIDSQGIQNFDLPGALDRDEFLADVLKIKNREAVYKNEYTFNNPKADPKVLEFKPASILIVEGLFVQYFEEIEKELDLKIFIEAKDHVKLSRRIRRDNEERGYDLNDVLYRYENHVMPIYETLIKPLQHRADLVIPNNSHFDRAMEVIVTFIKAKLKG